MANRFSKPKEEIKISDSLQDALIYLNKQNIEEGKIYSRRYFSTSAKTSVDVVLAVGVINGVGPSCYSIISHTKKTVVWGVSDKLPDVSEVTLGRLYIFWDSTKGLSYLVYLLSGNRIVEPVKFPLIVYNTGDGHYYYVSSDHITDIYEHLEESYVLEERITALEQQVKELIENGGQTDTTTPPPPVDPDEPENPDEPEDPEDDTTTPPPPVVNLVINSFKTSDEITEFEIGQVIDPKLVWSYNIPVDTQSINGTNLSASLREKTFNGVSSDITYTLSATAGSSVRTRSVSIRFSALSYLGGTELEWTEISEQNISSVLSGNMKSSLSNIECVGNKVITFESETACWLTVIFPKEIANKLEIWDESGAFKANWPKKSITIENQYGIEIEYEILQSTTPLLPGSPIKYLFKF